MESDWQYVIALWNAKQFSEIQGWPHLHLVWVVNAITSLGPAMSRAADKRAKAEARRQTRRGGRRHGAGF
jgi:hypothetical protein